MQTTKTAPCHITTVDQHRGTHHTGGTIRQLVDVRTSYGDHSQEPWESLSAADRAWWAEVLEDIHAAEVELAELDADHRARAHEVILDADIDRVEDEAACIRKAIADTAQAD